MALKFLNNGYFAGKVGIGTASPAAKLHIDPTTSDEIVIAINGTSNYSAGQFHRIAAGDSNSINRLAIGFGYDNPTDWAIRYSSYGRHEFYTGNDWGNAANTEKMVITSAGNVGIGTDNPGAKLEIKDGDLWLNGATGTSNPEIRFLDNDPSIAGAKIRYNNTDGNLYIEHMWDTSTSGIFFRNRTTGTTLNTMSLVNGNVGIGTTSPGEKLHVLGKALLNNGSSLYIDSSGTQTVFANIVDIPMRFQTNSGNRLTIGGAGAIQFNNYDSTNNTGTPTYLLGTDASGNVVKTLSTPGGDPGPYLPLAGGTLTGALGGTSATFTGNVGIGGAASDKVTVSGSGNLGIKINNSGNTSSDYSAIRFEQDTAEKGVIYTNQDDLYLRSPSGDVLLQHSGGNVGIGTTTPATTLHVDGGSLTNNVAAYIGGGFVSNDAYHKEGGLLVVSGTNATQTGAGIAFQTRNTQNTNYWKSSIIMDRAGAMRFTLGGAGTVAGSEDLTILSGGNVGIGVTSPGEKLEVNGNIKIQAALLSNQDNTDVDTGTETVANVAIATYTAAFFDFVIKKGTNVRSGTVYACHNGDTTPLVEFTETSTQDLGDTSDVTLSVDISGGNMRLRATSLSESWSVKTLIRAI